MIVDNRSTGGLWNDSCRIIQGGEMMQEGSTYIYSVAFHVKPGRRVHTFWFTDRKIAENFFESVRNYPKTIDCSMMQVAANEAAVYDGVIEESRIDCIRRETESERR